MHRPIENNARAGDIVYDPFLGSGTSLIAAEQCGRICYGRRLYTDGDTVIVYFDAEGPTRDGSTYRNTYAWFLKMHNGKVTDATAFFDSIAFNELWQQVKPAPQK
jgi:hypothetical protein